MEIVWRYKSLKMSFIIQNKKGKTTKADPVVISNHFLLITVFKNIKYQLFSVLK